LGKEKKKLKKKKKFKNKKWKFYLSLVVFELLKSSSTKSLRQKTFLQKCIYLSFKLNNLVVRDCLQGLLPKKKKKKKKKRK